VTIVDPCGNNPTLLYPSGFNQILEANQLESDSLNMPNAIASSGGNFPWLDSVSVNVGSSVCGPVSYRVEPVDAFVQL